MAEEIRKPVLKLPQSKQKKDKISKILDIVLIVIAAVILCGGMWWFRTVVWGKNTWSELTYQELIYTLSTMGGTNTDMVGQHILYCIVPALVLLAIFIIIAVIAFHRKTILHLAVLFSILAGVILGVIGTVWAWAELGMTEYLEAQESYGSFIDENYVDPTTVDLQFPEEKRNLIYIYLESMENTFADKASGGAFDENVIPELTKLSLENENFSGSEKVLNGGHAMTGATWTVAAMFAQTTGLPLSIPVSSNSMDLQEDFFPGVTALGDILESEGYRQILLLGSEAVFGGRELYFTQHGGYEMRDYNYYLNNGTLPEGYKVWWGYEDYKLFENAKTTLEELAEGDQPFNLTMLTVDTHFEDGYVCEHCGNDFEEQYSNVYACSSRQVSEFVQWVSEQPFYENTTIIISGDHETMDNDYCKYVDDYDRTVYTTVINAPVKYESRKAREYSTFDNFPTTLAAMGVEIPGDRLGLGVNLYSTTSTLYESYGSRLFNDGLNEKSELMENLTAGIITEFLSFDTTDYDAANKVLNVTVKNVSKPENTESLKAYVWLDGNEDQILSPDVTENDDGSCSFTVSFGDFGFAAGKYRMELYALTEGTEKYLSATSVNFDDTAEEITEEAASPKIMVGELNFQTGTFPVTVVNARANTTMMTLAIWTGDSQNDLKWLQMNMDENGNYYLDVNAVDFGVVTNTYTIHAYATYITGQSELLATKTYVIE